MRIDPDSWTLRVVLIALVALALAGFLTFDHMARVAAAWR